MKKQEKGEWVITYTPPGGGIGHSRLLSSHYPDICYDHEKFAEVMEAAKKIIFSDLNNPESSHYVHRDEIWLEFGLAWIEKFKLEVKGIENGICGISISINDPEREDYW